jgi:hypothetical protein
MLYFDDTNYVKAENVLYYSIENVKNDETINK